MQTRSNFLDGEHTKGDMLPGSIPGVRKNTPAAMKMAYPAAGGNPVGGGVGRGVHLGGPRMILNLVIYWTVSLQTESRAQARGQNLSTECGMCKLFPQEGQSISPDRTEWILKHCENRKPSRYCEINSTQYGICKLDNEINCFPWNARPKYRQSKLLVQNNENHKREKRNVELGHISECKLCNRTVWVSGQMKSVFLGYFQINHKCYDNSKLDVCVIEGKNYWVGQNVKYVNGMVFNNNLAMTNTMETDNDQVL